MEPFSASISKRYPGLLTATGGGAEASPDARTWVYCAAQVSVDSVARIAAPVRGRHEVAVVDAMAERNVLRESFFGSLIFSPLF
jgi:hypothetical protein